MYVYVLYLEQGFGSGVVLIQRLGLPARVRVRVTVRVRVRVRG